MTFDAPGKRASIAACTATRSVAFSGRANVTCVVTAVGVVVTDASDDTAAEVDAGDRLGVLVNQLPSADDAPPAADSPVGHGIVAKLPKPQKRQPE